MTIFVTNAIAVTAQYCITIFKYYKYDLIAQRVRFLHSFVGLSGCFLIAQPGTCWGVIEPMKRACCLFAVCFFLFSAIVHADFESEVLDRVNDERAAEGLGPLRYDASLTAAARDHSQDMGLNDYFDHTSQDGRSPGNRITAAGYSWNTYGENIAAGYATPAAVVSGWMNSPGHRANILNSNFCDLGVGYAHVPSSTYGHYWTQDFGRKSGVSSCPEAATYVITATVGAGGSINPDGNISVDQGDSQTFTITPHPGNRIDELTVDNQSKSITTSYTFSNVNSDHSIDVTFALNQSPPTAHAGSDQAVTEGDTVTLDGSQSSDPDDAVVRYEWTRLSGPGVTLSDDNAVTPTFVAGPISGNATVVFQLKVYDSGDDSDTDTVTISILENNIQQVPGDTIAIHTTTNRVMGLKPGANAGIVQLRSLDPAGGVITHRDGMPENLIYGLIDFTLAVSIPGSSSTVTVYLPAPLPAGYGLYKYSSSSGWYDYSAYASFNHARDQISLTLIDGGTGDEDGEPDGFIEDPFGFGTAPATAVSTGNVGSSSGGGGGGGCFIDTARVGVGGSSHWNTHPRLTLLF